MDISHSTGVYTITTGTLIISQYRGLRPTELELQEAYAMNLAFDEEKVLDEETARSARRARTLAALKEHRDAFALEAVVARSEKSKGRL